MTEYEKRPDRKYYRPWNKYKYDKLMYQKKSYYYNLFKKSYLKYKKSLEMSEDDLDNFTSELVLLIMIKVFRYVLKVICCWTMVENEEEEWCIYSRWIRWYLFWGRVGYPREVKESNWFLKEKGHKNTIRSTKWT